MATIDTRTDSKGNVKHRVRWREGGTRDGAWQSISFTRLKGETGAERFKAKVEAAGHHWPQDADLSGAISVPGTVTLNQLATAYLTDRAKRVRSDRTAGDYKRDYTNWIEPTFGAATMIDQITEEQVQAWVDGLGDGTIRHPTKPRAKPLEPKTIQDRHALLWGMFKFAMASSRRWVDRNPCDETVLPKRQKKAPKGLMPAEWTALERALRLIDPDAADVAEGLLVTGWRWSELTALDTFGVEDYGDALYLNMGRVVRRNRAHQHVIVEEGKGQASVRRVRLDPGAAAMVRRRMEGKKPGDLVFTTGRVEPGGTGGRANGLGGSRWHYSNFMERFWNPAVTAANLTRRPTPHWLRHTHVGWMTLTGKATLPELQARIGHASIATTINVYGGMLNDVSEDALGAFELMREQGKVPPNGQIQPGRTAEVI